SADPSTTRRRPAAGGSTRPLCDLTTATTELCTHGQSARLGNSLPFGQAFLPGCPLVRRNHVASVADRRIPLAPATRYRGAVGVGRTSRRSFRRREGRADGGRHGARARPRTAGHP